jgi:hypothetical protein
MTSRGGGLSSPLTDLLGVETYDRAIYTRLRGEVGSRLLVLMPG